jgi:dTDP-glucose 4,6-dehydratase
VKVLVTGGAGFIGSSVCRHLVLELGWSVVNVDKLTYAATLTSLASIEHSSRYVFELADVADPAAISRIFATHRPDAVIHLAAESHVDRSITRPQEFIFTNVVGSFVMLQSALEYWRSLSIDSRSMFRYLHVSTDEVYGTLGQTGLFDEATTYDPRSPYSASKAGSDHLTKAWYHTYGLPTIVSNCSNNYGPYQFPEKLIPLMILNILAGQELRVYGDGSNIRDWLHVEDHARALALVLQRGIAGETYNVGSRNQINNLQVVHTICDLVDEIGDKQASRELIRFVTDRPGHDQRYAIDPTKLEMQLGWRPQESFTTGLRKTVQWYIDRSDWWLPLHERYAGQRLGLETTQVRAWAPTAS